MTATPRWRLAQRNLMALVDSSPGATLLLATIVLASLIGLLAMPSLIQRNLFRPFWFIQRREYPTFITSAFIHADFAHLFFNAFTFWAFAFQLERTLGTARFLALYGFGLLASGAGTYFKHRSDPAYRCLGASGAILAVLFASIVYFPTASIFILPIPFPIPAPLFAVAVSGLQLLRVTARPVAGSITMRIWQGHWRALPSSH